MTDVPYDPTHPVYDLGECVLVSTTGEYLVRNGRVVKLTEVDTFSLPEGRVYTCYGEPEGDE